MKSNILILSLFLLGAVKSFATTWNEPWADKVIKGADYFVLADILSKNENSVKIKIIKQLGGNELPAEIDITNFYLLELTSFSGGHGPKFEFRNIERSFLFIKKNSEGEYCIATPSAGFIMAIVAYRQNKKYKEKMPNA